MHFGEHVSKEVVTINKIVMRIFWRSNLIISLSVFCLFLLDLMPIVITVNPSIEFYLFSITSWFFVYGAFLEIFQIPICIAALSIPPRRKRVLFYFILMSTLLITKVAIYLYVFGTAIGGS